LLIFTFDVKISKILGVFMANAGLFVVADEKGRIEGYRRSSESSLIFPEYIDRYLDGDDWIVHDGEEYSIDERGNLVHKEVELPKSARLGYGVLIGSGVQFGYHLPEVRMRGRVLEPATVELGPEPIKIDDRVVIVNPEGKAQSLHSGVNLQHHSVIASTSINRNTIIGPYSTAGAGSAIGADVVIGSQVEIGQNVDIGSGVRIEDNARIDRDNSVHPAVTIGHDSIVKTLPVPLKVDVPPNALAAPN
jgi:NDP-sugar pyrophosphorylase family protein